MKPITFFISLLAIGLLVTNCTEKESPVLTASTQGEPSPGAATGKMSHEQHVEYGKHLVEIMGCHDCHSPKVMTDHGPVPDPSRLLSGHPANEKLQPVTDKKVLENYALFNMSLTAAIGPWGTSFSANLTPDDTGLGNWSLDQFIKALQEGKFKGMDNGRMLLPPMPWQNFVNLTNNEIAAIWAYLQSIPPVNNVVPAPIPPMG